MRYIVIDLEMNAIQKSYRDERRICPTEVIEIGAVMLNESYEEINNFKTFVKPQYNVGIEKKYEELTGITTVMVSAAPRFERAFSDFVDWCFNGGKKDSENAENENENEDFKIYAWSDSDLHQLSKEVRLKKLEQTEKVKKVLSCIEDFQKTFTCALKLDKALSLEQAVAYAGIDFEGHQHDAFYDARNTAELFKMVKNGELCSDALKKVRDAVAGKEMTTCLGDQFDFAKLMDSLKK